MAKRATRFTSIDAPDAFWEVEMTPGAVDSGTIAIQVKDLDGNDVNYPIHFLAFLSDNPTGLDISTDAPSGGVAIGVDGSLALLVTNVFLLQSENDGDIDLVLTEAGADTWYLVVVLTNGRKQVSAAITFT